MQSDLSIVVTLVAVASAADTSAPRRRWARRVAVFLALGLGATGLGLTVQAAEPAAPGIGQQPVAPPVAGGQPGAAGPLVGIAQPRAGAEATWQLPADYARTIDGIDVLQVRPDVYLLTVAGVNVVVETGWQGTLVVGSGPADGCEQLVQAVKALAIGPIRYLVESSADAQRVGCNEQLAKAGQAFVRGVLGFAAPVIAHQNALLQLIGQPGQRYAEEALPSEIFTRSVRSMWMNDQGIQVIWMPAAHTNGDTVVLFRHSEVVATGDLMDYWHFPMIDVKHGGSVTGEIAALNRILDELAVAVTPKWQLPGGTLVIPGRGPLCQQVDVLNYRDMVTIIRDRVQDLIQHGRTLEQVQAADPARGYKARYGADSGDWTTRDFVAAVYQSLQSDKARASK